MPTDRTNQISVEDNKVYLITGKSLNEILAAIKRNKPLAGKNVTLSESDTGVYVNGEDCPPCAN